MSIVALTSTNRQFLHRFWQAIFYSTQSQHVQRMLRVLYEISCIQNRVYSISYYHEFNTFVIFSLYCECTTYVRTKSFQVTNHQYIIQWPPKVFGDFFTSLFFFFSFFFSLAGCIKSAVVHHINYGYVLLMSEN